MLTPREAKLYCGSFDNYRNLRAIRSNERVWVNRKQLAVSRMGFRCLLLQETARGMNYIVEQAPDGYDAAGKHWTNPCLPRFHYTTASLAQAWKVYKTGQLPQGRSWE